MDWERVVYVAQRLGQVLSGLLDKVVTVRREGLWPWRALSTTGGEAGAEVLAFGDAVGRNGPPALRVADAARF